MPEANAEAFRGGWFHTGDLGRLDEKGNLYFEGRKKDAIRRRGENISAFEVEQVIESHPAVLEAAAYGVPSEHTRRGRGRGRCLEGRRGAHACGPS